ncbi:hypothetical protein HII31_06241 [Pseudocercospora fuligena]|uniref:DUF7730 domain-containing protein n=1 Tax=Pseudocercospora fuligena TaxID=685502 RepID=A0A8H6VLA0_9PEZI|nr:hypothetical protein HII31_06241 [Pseudocercospora fuligena]
MQKLIHKAKEWRKRRRERRSISKSNKRESSIRPQTKDSRLTTNTAEPEDANTVQISSNYHTQEQSALFATLPGEIRVLIWSYALAPTLRSDASNGTAPTIAAPTQSNGLNATGATDAAINEAGTKEPRCHTSLLLTCRRIYSEASHLGLEQAEPIFNLFYPDRDTMDHHLVHLFAGQTVMTLVELDVFLRSLTSENRRLMKGVRLRSNWVWLCERKFFNTFAVARGCWPKRLVVEISGSGNNGDLRLEKGVGDQMLRQALDAGARELVVEVVGGKGEGLRQGLAIDEDEWDFVGEESLTRRSEGEMTIVKRLRWKLA